MKFKFFVMCSLASFFAVGAEVKRLVDKVAINDEVRKNYLYDLAPEKQDDDRKRRDLFFSFAILTKRDFSLARNRFNCLVKESILNKEYFGEAKIVSYKEKAYLVYDYLAFSLERAKPFCFASHDHKYDQWLKNLPCSDSEKNLMNKDRLNFKKAFSDWRQEIELRDEIARFKGLVNSKKEFVGCQDSCREGSLAFDQNDSIVGKLKSLFENMASFVIDFEPKRKAEKSEEQLSFKSLSNESFETCSSKSKNENFGDEN